MTGAVFARGTLALFYLIAAAFHLARPGPFLRILPGWVPQPEAVVLATGVAEGLGALALVQPWSQALRRAGAIGLALYALCVWPANIKHAVEHIVLPSIPDTWWYHGPRLALQPVLIWWALYCSSVIDWPGRSR